MENYRVGIVGATGLVGQELLRILEERNFPVSDIKVYSTEGPINKSVLFKRQSVSFSEIGRDSFLENDIVFFIAGDSVSKKNIPAAVESGSLVIDGSAFSRLESDVPLVIPEINADDMTLNKRIISSPACLTIMLNLVLYPLHKLNNINRVFVSSYQSASGMGGDALRELIRQTRETLSGRSLMPNIFPHEMAFNLLPQVDVFLDNGYTKEEWQLLGETRKILHDEKMNVSATCVRVPTLKSHCMSVNIEFDHPMDADKARDILAESQGIRVLDDPGVGLYPQPRTVSGIDEVMVGRIRQEAFNDNGLALWVAADNIRITALNMVQIAEEINKKG